MSPTAALRRSIVQAELIAVADSQFQQIQAVWPLWGVGTFPTPGSDNYVWNGFGYPDPGADNPVWPFVYQTITESWSQGGGTRSRVSHTNDDFANPWTTTDTSAGGGIDDSGGYTFVSATSTVKTLTFQDSATPPNVGTYTAEVSSQFNPLTGWAGLTANANALLANLTLPDISLTNTNRTQVIYPDSSASLGFTIYDSDHPPAIFIPPADDPDQPGTRYNFIAGCCNGLGVKLISDNLGSPSIVPWLCGPIGYEIYDYPGSYQYLTLGDTNFGGVLCSAALWLLAGKSSNVVWSGGSFHAFDHRTIYGQAMNIDGTTGALSMGGGITPGSFSNPNNFSANGATYTNPITQFKKKVRFNTGDVNTNIGSLYGMLGFTGTPW